MSGDCHPEGGSEGGSERAGEERSPGEAGGRPAGASGTTWSERRKETAAGKGWGSLVNSRPGPGAFLALDIFSGALSRMGWGSLVFRGYVLCRVSVIQWGWDLEGKDIITIFVQQS